MSWMDYEETGEMKEDLRNQSQTMATVLDAEMRKLKFKAVRCAKNCLTTKKDFREALLCERTCLNSIVHMKSFMELKTKTIHKHLKQCLNIAEKSVRGFSTDSLEEDSGQKYALNCYSAFQKQMIKAQSEIVVEFSYFE